MAFFEEEEIEKFHLPITGKNGKWKFSLRGYVFEGGIVRREKFPKGVPRQAK